MRFEFEVELTPVKQLKKKEKPKKEPLLRRSLSLAYQIQALLDQGKTKSLLQLAGWLHMSIARISQILNLLNLAPEIQQEILLPQDEATEKITEYHIRWIAMETDWQKQTTTWESLLKKFLTI